MRTENSLWLHVFIRTSESDATAKHIRQLMLHNTEHRTQNSQSAATSHRTQSQSAATSHTLTPHPQHISDIYTVVSGLLNHQTNRSSPPPGGGLGPADRRWSGTSRPALVWDQQTGGGLGPAGSGLWVSSRPADLLDESLSLWWFYSI